MKTKIAVIARSLGLALAAATLAVGCASPQSSVSRTGNSRAQAQIERRVQEVLDAAEKKEFDRLDSYHLYGPKFTKFTASSPDRLDAAAGRNGEHKGLGSINDLKMRAEALKIDLFGDVGIATFILDYTFTSNGEKMHRQDRTTLVFVKDGGEWKIAHEHLSPIQQS
jgi:ketosteroid isomerase-like protein